MSNSFPVFGASGLEGDLIDATGGNSPSATTFAGPAPMSLPTVHDDREALAADAKFRLTLQLTRPELLKALDRQAAKRLQHQQYTELVTSLSATVATLTNRVLLTPPDSPGLRQERSAALKLAESELSESREELAAAREELQDANAAVASLQAVPA